MMRPGFDKWLNRPDNQADLTYEEWLDNYVAALELDAQRYRKLKAAISEDHKRFDGEGYSISDGSKALSIGATFDAAVDALPD